MICKNPHRDMCSPNCSELDGQIFSQFYTVELSDSNHPSLCCIPRSDQTISPGSRLSAILSYSPN
ncbi:hypothetical protein BpHYR1_006257 [Brachionus plicatilis]|uniref:Uncharacterized protein n=1 Tax=Brachionus plicatilis TaxID=10195 RepID=A0A3M7QUE3_BRAPC|nr:hypothetical protein BpHYR1_006257 [Brachionus plicatilis]